MKGMVRAGLTRRRFGGLAMAMGALGLPAPAWALEPVNRTFEIFRKGDHVGEHRVTFSASATGMEVVTEIDIAVKVAFITAYRYTQRGRDAWAGPRLVASEISTDDDGRKTHVVLGARDGQLLGEGPEGRIELPLGDMTDLCWWNPGIVQRQRLLDSQTGIVSPLDTWDLGRRSFVSGGQPVEAQGFGIRASEARGGEVWYDDEGGWVSAVLHTRGEVLEYRLRA